MRGQVNAQPPKKGHGLTGQSIVRDKNQGLLISEPVLLMPGARTESSDLEDRANDISWLQPHPNLHLTAASRSSSIRSGKTDPVVLQAVSDLF